MGSAEVPCHPSSAPWFISLAAAGCGLKAQDQALPTVGFPCASGGGSMSPVPRSHCFGGAFSLVPRDLRVAVRRSAAG